MNKYVACLFVSFGIALFSLQVDAHSIQQGTVTFGISAFNEDRNFEKETDSREYSLNVNGGYFMQDNFELGTGLSYDRFRSSSRTSTTWTVSPLILYHVPLQANSDVYGGGGVFLTKSETIPNSGTKTHSDSSGYIIRAGWEYFFNANVALDIAFSFSQVEWDLSGFSVSSDREKRFYWPRIGFRLYF